MKKLSFYSFVVLLLGVLFFTACENTFNGPGPEDENSILPDQLSVEIPAALLDEASSLKGAPVVDTLKGREIYGHLRFFIHTGNHAGRIVKHIIYGIRRYNIDQVKTVTYESEDDGRIKNLVVVEGPEFDGRTWEYGLTITDAESEGEADGGKERNAAQPQLTRKALVVIGVAAEGETGSDAAVLGEPTEKGPTHHPEDRALPAALRTRDHEEGNE